MHETGAVTARVSSTKFVGRRRELARLEETWRAAADDEAAATVLVGGEAGVGKSRLVAELVERLSEPSLVLTGQCIELVDRALPFGPIVQALRELHRVLDEATFDAVVGPAAEELSALIPELHASQPGEAVRAGALFEQLLGVFERLGDRVPTLLVIEDLHWADQSTRHLVSFLARSLRHRVVVCSERFGPTTCIVGIPSVRHWRNSIVRAPRRGSISTPSTARRRASSSRRSSAAIRCRAWSTVCSSVPMATRSSSKSSLPRTFASPA